MKIYGMSLVWAGSISVDSTFKREILTIFFIIRTGAGQVPDGAGHGGGDARLPGGGTLPRHRPFRPQGQEATRHCQVGGGSYSASMAKSYTSLSGGCHLTIRHPMVSVLSGSSNPLPLLLKPIRILAQIPENCCKQCCGSGFNGVPGSGSVFAIRIRVQEDRPTKIEKS